MCASVIVKTPRLMESATNISKIDKPIMTSGITIGA